MERPSDDTPLAQQFYDFRRDNQLNRDDKQVHNILVGIIEDLEQRVQALEDEAGI